MRSTTPPQPSVPQRGGQSVRLADAFDPAARRWPKGSPCDLFFSDLKRYTTTTDSYAAFIVPEALSPLDRAIEILLDPERR